MSSQPCRVDTPDAHEHRPRRRLDKRVGPCRGCGIPRAPGSFPFNSHYCTECHEDRYNVVPVPHTVPTAPLAARIEWLITMEEALEPFSKFRPSERSGGKPAKNLDRFLGAHQGQTRRVGICERAGISAKSLQEWREGRRKTVPWNTADRVLQNLGWFWWEVWTPENTPAEEYQALCEGLG